ncbi:hypothetical protein SDC9_101367 [bioreactor metagenome]|uniref:Uncharacterized protein n=1 Tax=bioreactor metagenome TaxID=1076179 RepID=A0A645AN27_9ZZZZ
MHADAVLAGAGAAQADGALHQLAVECLGLHALFGHFRVDQIAEVEIAVTHVADQEVGDAAVVGLFHRVEQRIGQAADGHAGVGADGAAAGA